MRKYFKEEKGRLSILMILMIILFIFATSIQRIYGEVTKIATENLIKEAYNITIFTVFVIFGIFLIQALTNFLTQRISSYISESIRNDLIDEMYIMDFNSFRGMDRKNLLSTFINDIENIEKNYFGEWISLISQALQLLIMLYFVYRIDGRYVIIILGLSIFSIFQPLIFKNKLKENGKYTMEAYSDYTRNMNEYISGVETIKTNGKSKVFYNKFKEDTDSLETTRLSENNIKSINSSIMLLAVYILKVGSILVFANDVTRNIITLSMATVLFGYANNIGNPIADISNSISNLQSISQVRKKVENLYNLEEGVEKSGLKGFNKIIKVKDLEFSYGDRKIISSISNSFSKGKKYAVYGRSGSGKSTFLKLLAGYHNDYIGSIKIDDMELKDINKESLWEELVYIKQDVFIMSGSVRDNITFLKDIYTDDQIAEVVRLACLEELINSLPNGLDERIGEGGRELSGGEKQRISIARGLLSDKDILILDEAFSALDNHTAKIIEKNILTLDKTIISITHRQSSYLYKYDEILLLNDGRIVDKGNLEDIKTSNGLLNKFLFGEKEQVVQ